MYRSYTQAARRRGFTLIELLIVMGILVILALITLSAVMRVLASGDRATANSEIRELAQALETCKSSYSNMRFIPSRLILRRDMTSYAANGPIQFGQTIYTPSNQDNQRSAQTLQAMFGKAVFSNTNLNWSNNSADTTSTGWVLFGPECLVFFTGGIMSDPNQNGGIINAQGFSNVNSNPTQAVGTRNGPFYQNFKSNRFVKAMFFDQKNKAFVPTGFFQYQDPLETGPGQPGTPYAFFSSYGGGGSGNTYKFVTQPTTAGAQIPAESSGDCYTLPTANVPLVPPPFFAGLNPYVGPGTPPATIGLFMNPNSYQIISAGPDHLFGTGGVWNPLTGDSSTTGNADNLSNFSRSQLGNSQS